MGFLVLNRQPGQGISIGASQVRVAGIKGNRVKLAITAPADMPIDRLEIAAEKLAKDVAAKLPDAEPHVVKAVADEAIRRFMAGESLPGRVMLSGSTPSTSSQV